MATREDVFKAIDTERAYQHARWPGHRHPVGTFLTYMTTYLADAAYVATHGYTEDHKVLEALRKFAALGVACMEENGAVPHIEDTLTPSEYLGRKSRDVVYKILSDEREYQDRKWKVEHEISEELTLLRHYMRRADEAWAVNVGDLHALVEIRKAVAVAVRCMERHGAPKRTRLMPSQVI